MSDDEKGFIKFGDLSFPLKFIVIVNWIIFGLYLIAFLVGFISGISGA